MDDEDVKRHITRIPLATAVVESITRIRRAGGRAWVVGGAVRDWVWDPAHFTPDTTDWDVTTDLSREALTAIRSNSHPGERFGTFQLAPGVEVTQMRTEGLYTDRRHPGRVQRAGHIAEDLKRRDFTVNAVAFDGRHVVAVAGGLHDLRLRRLRAVGDPELRFREDPLRLLRLVRFQGTWDASVDAETEKAARQLSRLAAWVSRERRLDEFLRFLESPSERWHLWHQAGLESALEWPDAPSSWQRCPMANPPQHPAARLAAYAIARYGDAACLHRWAQDWPLRRAWRTALMQVAVVDASPACWARAARQQSAHRWMFEALARAAGWPADGLRPVVPVLTAREVMDRWHLQGKELGAALQYLQHVVSEAPEVNHGDRLAALLEAWIHGRSL